MNELVEKARLFLRDERGDMAEKAVVWAVIDLRHDPACIRQRLNE